MCAPTGAGKTLIAQYSIEKILKETNTSKIIYTAPLKAISNQKYLDFVEEYGKESIGLITGDISLNHQARILIMTTEILRNILYQNPVDLINVKYVVFDEVHYLNDPYRGTVWEECLILLLPNIQLILLSATISNASELAEWVYHIRKDKIHVIVDTKRKVPLRHFILDDNELVEPLNHNTDRSLHLPDFYYNPLFVLSELPKHFYPVLIFLFSRKGCKEAAIMVANDREESLLTEKEKERILEYIQLYKSTITPDDEELSTVQVMLRLIPHGIAFHHAGLLPSLKSLVEQLFSQNLIKTLFTTETFALGVNYPAKTTFFPSLEKWDGQDYRTLTSTEFIQMSGRAGRRGIDTEGFVIVNGDEIPPWEFDKLIEYQPMPVRSQFRIGYNLVVNLRLDPDLDPYIVLEKSLLNYQTKKTLLHRKKQISAELEKITNKLLEIERTCNTPNDLSRELITKYGQIHQELDMKKTQNYQYKKKLQLKVQQIIINEYCKPGQIVYTSKEGWGVGVGVSKRKAYAVTIYSPTNSKKFIKRNLAHVAYTKILLEEWATIDQYNISDSEERIFETFLEELKNNPPEKYNYQVIQKTIKTRLVQQKKDNLTSRTKQLPCEGCAKKKTHLQLFNEHLQKSTLLDKLNKQSELNKKSLYHKFTRFEIVLKSRGYISEDNQLTRKGELLTLITNEHDLLIMEWLLRHKKHKTLDIHEWNGIFSIFVTNKNKNQTVYLPGEIEVVVREITRIRSALIKQERKLAVQGETQTEWTLSMFEEIQNWSRGVSLDRIQLLSPHSEGEILSIIRRQINLYQQLLPLQKEMPFPFDIKQAIQHLKRGEAWVRPPKRWKEKKKN